MSSPIGVPGPVRVRSSFSSCVSMDRAMLAPTRNRAPRRRLRCRMSRGNAAKLCGLGSQYKGGTMRRLFASAILVAAMLPVTAHAQEKINLSIGTGGTGGVYYPLGGALANILSKYVPGMQASAEV